MSTHAYHHKKSKGEYSDHESSGSDVASESGSGSESSGSSQHSEPAPPLKRAKHRSSSRSPSIGGNSGHHHHRHHHHKHGDKHKKYDKKRRHHGGGDSDEDLHAEDRFELARAGVDDCRMEEERSVDGSDSGSDVKDFIVDDDAEISEYGSGVGEHSASSSSSSSDADEPIVMRGGPKVSIGTMNINGTIDDAVVRDQLKSSGFTGQSVDLILSCLKAQQTSSPSPAVVADDTSKQRQHSNGGSSSSSATTPPGKGVNSDGITAANAPPASFTGVLANIAGSDAVSGKSESIGAEALPMTYDGYTLLLQTTGVGEYFKKSGKTKDYDSWVDDTPEYKKVVAAMSSTRVTFNAAFKRLKCAIIDACHRKVTSAAVINTQQQPPAVPHCATPTPRGMASPPPLSRSSTFNNVVCFSEQSHEGVSQVSPALSPGVVDSSKFCSPDNGGFLAQIFDSASQCYSIDIHTEVQFNANNLPCTYDDVNSGLSSALAGITISSSTPIANPDKLKCNSQQTTTTTTPSNVEALANMCIVGMRFYSDHMSTWKTYVMPRGIALFAALVNNSKRLDRRICTRKLFADMPTTATDESVFDDVNGYIEEHKAEFDALWNDWKADFIALKSLVGTFTRA